MSYIKLLTAIFMASVFFVSCKKDDVKLKETVVYETDFSSNDGRWVEGQTQGGRASIQNGRYIFTSETAANKYSILGISPVFPNNVTQMAIEARLSISGLQPNEAYGGLSYRILANSQTALSVENFSIYRNGYFKIFGNKTDGTFYSVQDPVLSQAINENADNILRVELRPGSLRYLINGTEVLETVTNISTLDQIAFHTRGGATVSTDYFKAINLN